jgi:hypothetical protein
MTDAHARPAHSGDPAAPRPVRPDEDDRDLNIPAILWTTAGVIAITLLSVVAMWAMFKGFVKFDERGAPPPPPMSETMRQTAPPEPRLQAAPAEDMTAMRREDARLLEHAGWIDHARGTVRVPIDVAIDVLAERGLPKVTTPPLADMVAHGSTAGSGRPPTDQPSPGTLLIPPGMGVGSIGPPSAGAGQQAGAAEMGQAEAAGAPAAGVNATSPPASTSRPPGTPRPPQTPSQPPPPPGGLP